jgi:hypothetical protein
MVYIKIFHLDYITKALIPFLDSMKWQSKKELDQPSSGGQSSTPLPRLRRIFRLKSCIEIKRVRFALYREWA